MVLISLAGLPMFVSNFLKDRQFQVRLGSNLSSLFYQEMGVPLGNILSVTLFALKINSIVQAICPNFECSLYVDDFLICYSIYISLSDICSAVLINSMIGLTPTDFASERPKQSPFTFVIYEKLSLILSSF